VDSILVLDIYNDENCTSYILKVLPIHLKFQYASIFRRGEPHAIPSSLQGTASMTSTASLDNSLSDMYRSPPRPLPYDSDPRFFHSQRDGLVSRREKGSSHLNEESEPLRGDVDADSESLNLGGKWNDTSEDGSKEYRKSSVRLSSAKLTTGAGVVYSSSEVEDVCPTCLEGKIFICTQIFIRIFFYLYTNFHQNITRYWGSILHEILLCSKILIAVRMFNLELL